MLARSTRRAVVLASRLGPRRSPCLPPRPPLPGPLRLSSSMSSTNQQSLLIADVFSVKDKVSHRGRRSIVRAAEVHASGRPHHWRRDGNGKGHGSGSLHQWCKSIHVSTGTHFTQPGHRAELACLSTGRRLDKLEEVVAESKNFAGEIIAYDLQYVHSILKPTFLLVQDQGRHLRPGWRERSLCRCQQGREAP